ncbi:hypothetical protein [Streptomyces sp. MMBL 11-1]|uniref:hypothetical protein n=1 Tax=Streptomyces sp. MMBL 11-1 TaxID=3026420 RepID=UPI002362AD58|nr:hypothetical protein [Streptomyces sp. MMBL 11-1]
MLEMVVPACAVAPSHAVSQWTLQVQEQRPGADNEGQLPGGQMVLELPYGGRRLTMLEATGGVMRLAAAYRPGQPPAGIEVDARRRVTRLVVAAGDAVGLRWADYLARVFFASRLLAAGWRMLHASAVAVEGRALVFLAGRHGGKSTLAHRAVRELGALFMADDLVLIGPDGTVMGWPTRVAVPAQLLHDTAVGRRERTVVAGVERYRVLFTPAQHRAALGIGYSPPVPLGAVVMVDGDAAGTCARSGTEVLERAVARAARVPQQLLYVSDPLGLMGGPRLADQAAAAPPAEGLLAGVPAAVVRVAVGHLPSAPVWQGLEGIIPRVGRGR